MYTVRNVQEDCARGHGGRPLELLEERLNGELLHHGTRFEEKPAWVSSPPKDKKTWEMSGNMSFKHVFPQNFSMSMTYTLRGCLKQFKRFKKKNARSKPHLPARCAPQTTKAKPRREHLFNSPEDPVLGTSDNASNSISYGKHTKET